MDMHMGFEQASKTDGLVGINLHNSTQTITLYQSLVIKDESCEIMRAASQCLSTYILLFHNNRPSVSNKTHLRLNSSRM